ncbi:MAG: SDR family oxidoreductase [Inquilinus sp.]|nr:SDR family oxidoreductase [Inquilinus sp.]
MQIVVTGGGGFIGRRLIAALLARDSLTGPDGRSQPIDRVIAFDKAVPSGTMPEDPRLMAVAGDIADPAALARLIGADTGLVFHLAAIVSGEAEANFDLGMAVNVDGTRALLEACRRLATPPRLVFASSVAVFGGGMPRVIRDDSALTPLTSYGTQKAIGEHLVNDYSRKGFLDGRALRLPTIVVRPGKPNKAASSFASGIIREPLTGQDCRCPVAPDSTMWILSPRRVVEAFLRAAELPGEAFGDSRSLTLPGLSATVAEMVEALRAVGGDAAVARIRFEPDPLIQRIVSGWPGWFEPERAVALGFAADPDIVSIVRAFAEDELGGAAAPAT